MRTQAGMKKAKAATGAPAGSAQAESKEGEEPSAHPVAPENLDVTAVAAAGAPVAPWQDFAQNFSTLGLSHHVINDMTMTIRISKSIQNHLQISAGSDFFFAPCLHIFAPLPGCQTFEFSFFLLFFVLDFLFFLSYETNHSFS